ncbi:MAG TPA: hypothetical protein VFP37_09255 [Steroidobacteraceae bacterium]|nr:hypothetical protein [Steroidobacteraceae bacterium]
MKSLMVMLAVVTASGTAQAALLVNRGAKATLTVQYDYSATGKKADKFEPREWRVQRTIKLVVPMTADAPQPVSSLRPMDAGYAAEMDKKKGQIQELHKTMAPTMQDMMKIAERCNENEACIEKAIQEYSTTMDRSTIEKGKSQVASASGMSGPRYQLWQPLSEKGTYSVDESYRGQTSDPLCSGKPKQRCTREETRKGGGDIPMLGGVNRSAALLEIDDAGKEILIKLPVPLGALTYTRQVTTDFPDEKSGSFPGTLPPMVGQQKTLTVPLTGDLRNASGSQSFKMDGAEGEGGTLTVSWQFALQ